MTGITGAMPTPKPTRIDVADATIAAVRRGDMDALAELYRMHARLVYGAAYRLLLSAADAEDVLQDVFVGLPEALRSYEDRGTFDSWLKTVTVRTALMRLRSQRRLRETSADLASTHASPRPGILDRVAARDAIARLPDTMRVVFMLAEVEGYSHDEIGEMLAISSRASATRLHRAWTLILRDEKEDR